MILFASPCPVVNGFIEEQTPVLSRDHFSLDHFYFIVQSFDDSFIFDIFFNVKLPGICRIKGVNKHHWIKRKKIIFVIYSIDKRTMTITIINVCACVNVRPANGRGRNEKNSKI